MEDEITEEDVVAVDNISDNPCILCTSIVSSCGLSEDEGDQQDGGDFLDKLVKFEEELIDIVSKSNAPKIPESSCLSSSSSTSAYRSSSIKNKRISGYLSKKMYKVCPNCKILMLSAFTSKYQLDEMESHVRYLQRAILRALKVVDRHLKKFSRDLSKIGEVIKVSKNNDTMSKTKAKRNPKSLTADVLGFRECILNAVTNLNQFRKVKQSKTIDTIGNHRKPPQISHPEVVLSDDDKGAGMNPASPMESDNIADDHNDYWLPDHNEDDHDDHNEDNNDEYIETDNNQVSHQKRKKHKISPSAPPQFINDLDLLKESPRPILGKRYFSILEPVTSSMSPFKAAIVRRTFNKSKRKPRQTEPEGPLASHYVTYNADTDVLSVDNQIEIRFNEIDQCLECTQCSYSCKGSEESETNRNTSEKKMMYHILGKHMNIFKCEQCDKQMPSYPQYVKHRELHKKMGTGSEPVCETCGKVLKSVESFEDHKWVHMTKEEKEEAKRQGKKDPADKFKKLPRRYQCQQCGKGFRRPCELKKHMRGVHGEMLGGEEAGEVEKFMCGNCGVMFKQMGNLSKHLKLERCKGARKNERKVKEEMIVS